MLKFFLSSSLVLLCSALFESSILSNLTFLPAIPDISLICVLFLALHNGKLYGEGTGFISGLMLDFLSSGPFGFNCLLRTLIGYTAGWFNKTLNTEGFFVSMFLGFCATLIKGLYILFIHLLFPKTSMIYNPLSFVFLFELIFNTILTPFIFKFLNLFKKSLILNPENTIQ